VYDKLLDIRNKLEKLSLTQAWSMRETDLWSYQRQLDRIDEARVDGNFIDALGRPAEIYEQRVRRTLNLDCIDANDVDIALSSAQKLRVDIPAFATIRACFRSVTADL
jgi:hypothetical protein